MKPLLDVQQSLLLLLVVALLFAGSWLLGRRRVGVGPRQLLPLLVLALFAAAFFWRVLFTSGVLMPIGGGDLNSFFYPIYSAIHRAIGAGEFPLWNPYNFLGIPLAADVQSGMFYPPNLLSWFVLGRYDYGTLESLLILHYLWASLGAYLWLRDLKISPLAALAGAGAFAYCGFMSAHFGHMPMIFVAAWLPWHLLLARRTILSVSWSWPIVAGLTLGTAFLAGHPQTFLYEALALGLYWLFLLWELREQGLADGPLNRLSGRLGEYGYLLRPILRAGLALLILVGLSAVQLLPSNELAGQSIRDSITFEQAGEHAIQPIGLLNLILPGIFGSNPSNYWVSWQSTENWGHIGVVTLVLAAFGLLLRRNRAIGFLVALAALALLVMVGPASVVFGWIHGLLPGFDRFRAPGRMLLMFSFAMAGLAAFGLDALMRLFARRMAPTAATADSNKTFHLALYGLTGATALVFFVIAPFFSAIFISSYSLERAQLVLNEVNMLAVWLLLALGILWAATRKRIGATLAVLLLGGLMLVDLFSANAAFNPTSQNILAGYQQPQAVAEIKNRLADPGAGRIDSDTGVEALWQPMLGMLEGLPDAGGLYNPLQLRRYTDFWNTIKSHRDNAVYDMLNIRFMITSDPALAQGDKWESIYQGADGLRVYQNNNAFSRVFLVHDAVVEPDDATALGKLINGTYLAWHTVVLSGGAEQRRETASTVENNPAESAAIVDYSSDRLTARVTASEPGWAVFSEVWYPGWEATIDGQPATIERANVALRAVAVPAGAHTIEMRFRPTSLITGAIVTGATLVLTLLGLLITALLGRRRHTRTLG